jgi:hypothetical protein
VFLKGLELTPVYLEQRNRLRADQEMHLQGILQEEVKIWQNAKLACQGQEVAGKKILQNAKLACQRQGVAYLNFLNF